MTFGNYYTESIPVKHYGGICEAHDCNSVATIPINEKVGNQGLITLYLCERCAHEFREEQK